MTYYNVKELLQFLNENEKMKGIDKHITDLFIRTLEFEISEGKTIITEDDLSDLVQYVDAGSIGEGNLVYYPDIETDFYRLRKELSIEAIEDVEQEVRTIYEDNPNAIRFDLMFCLSYYDMQFHSVIDIISEIQKEEVVEGLIIEFDTVETQISEAPKIYFNIQTNEYVDSKEEYDF